MSEFQKINVALYGGKGIFGGRETPLEADIIHCDKSDVCSFYKQQKCLNLRSPLSPYCKFGKRQTVKGYTSRAKKYYTFREKYTKDEVYSKLKYPQDWAVASIGDYILLNLIWLTVEKDGGTDGSLNGRIQKTIVLATLDLVQGKYHISLSKTSRSS